MEQALQRVRENRTLRPQALADVLAEEAIRLTNSTIGYFAVTDAAVEKLTMLAWSRSAMADCAVNAKPMEYPIAATGIWGDCIRERKAVITNDYPNCTRPTKKGYPEGHVPVLRHMNVPVMCDGKIVGILGVGNKTAEYSEKDAALLQAFADAAWPIVAPTMEEVAT